MSREEILAQVDSYTVLAFYLAAYHNEPQLMQGHNISNPFLSEKQETPSFNIFCDQKGGHEWKFKDFATEDKGSCFDLVMKLFNLDFNEAKARICQDFNLSDPTLKTVNRIEPTKPMSEKKSTDYSIKPKDFNKQEIDFWSKYGITIDILNSFKVRSLAEFSSKNKEGNPYSFRSDNNNLIFAYDMGNWCKLYKPLDKKFRFQYLGDKPQNFVFGLDQLPEKGDFVFLTGGEKDVMSLAAKGYHAISLNSETAKPTPELLAELRSRFSQIVVLYDNDKTGIEQSKELSKTFGLSRVTLPSLSNNGKDISDFFATGGTIDGFNNLVQERILQGGQNADSEPVERTSYNAVELLALGNTKPQYLLEPLFPQKGTAVIAGKPDTGKSQFARQLCIQVALGLPDFLGFSLNLIHKSAVYVATEDSLEATTYLLKTQLEGLQEPAKENLRFIFADTMEQTEILEGLEEELKKAPADLVVVDSFGDIFKGGDSNNNMAMRNTVKAFDKIAKQQGCLILFVHHINKGAYRLTPGQEHIQGGAGLVQKVRLAIQLSEGEGSIRYFSVVKGNYCPKEYKDNTLELNFSEETFLFSFSGKMLPTSEIGAKPEGMEKETKMSELERIADEIFGSKILSYGQFAKDYCAFSNKSTATAKRVIRDLKKFELIVDCNGGYRLASFELDSQEEEEEEDVF
jgi:hypothetical protein